MAAKKAVAKKVVAKKAAPKKAVKKAGNANSAFMRPKVVSPALQAIVGKGPLPTTEVVKKLWVYIKKNDLQNPKNKRNIIADDKLLVVFDGKKEISMFEMTKYVTKNLS